MNLAMEDIRSWFNKSDILPNQRTTIIGKTGQGKSVFMDNITKYLASKGAFIIFMDTKKEYEHLKPFSQEILEKIKKGKPLKGIYRCFELTYNNVLYRDMKIICEFFSKLLIMRNQKKKFKKLNSMLAIEELGNVTKKVGRLYDIMPEFAILLQQGRGQNVGFIGTSQRPQEVHTTVLSQSDHIISFLVTSEQDRKAMNTYIDKANYAYLNRFEFFHLNFKKNFMKHCYRLRLDAKKIEYYNKIFGES